MGRRVPKCPKCNAHMLPIEYGLPDAELLAEAERGEVLIGGCIVDPDCPEFACLGPEEHLWRRPERGGLAAVRHRGVPR